MEAATLVGSKLSQSSAQRIEQYPNCGRHELTFAVSPHAQNVDDRYFRNALESHPGTFKQFALLGALKRLPYQIIDPLLDRTSAAR
jgi:hypothetical protein